MSEEKKLDALKKIVPPKNPPKDTPDDITKGESEKYDLAKRKTELDGIIQDQEQRKEYADKIFLLIVWWLIAIFLILVCQGLGAWTGFKLSDKVLVTLIGGTTINVLGIFAIVANYIFYRKNKK